MPPARRLELLKAQSQLTGEWAQEGKLTEDEIGRLTQLREAFEQKFGFPFVLWANGCQGEVLIERLNRRLSFSESEEMKIAWHELEKIALNRLGKIWPV